MDNDAAVSPPAKRPRHASGVGDDAASSSRPAATPLAVMAATPPASLHRHRPREVSSDTKAGPGVPTMSIGETALLQAFVASAQLIRDSRPENQTRGVHPLAAPESPPPAPTEAPSSHPRVRELQSSFECPVCRQLLYNPVTLKCGHSLCEGCMLQFLQKGTGACKCPAGCQTPIPYKLPPVNIAMCKAIKSAFPDETHERESESEGVVTPDAREDIARKSAICSLLRVSEGRQLQELRGYFREVRRQNIHGFENIRQMHEVARMGVRRGGARALAGRGRGADRGVGVTALLTLAFAVCTWWAITKGSNPAALSLRWDKVAAGEYWRMFTAFVTLDPRGTGALCSNAFTLLRLYQHSHYEAAVGSMRVAGTLAIGVTTMLMLSYFGIESSDRSIDGGRSGFLSHDIVFFLMLNYCWDSPLMFLYLVVQLQVESLMGGQQSGQKYLLMWLVVPCVVLQLLLRRAPPGQRGTFVRRAIRAFYQGTPDEPEPESDSEDDALSQNGAAHGRDRQQEPGRGRMGYGATILVHMRDIRPRQQAR